MKTQRGIELNLKESEYYCEMFGLRFYFSSVLYLDKFKTNVIDFINLETIRTKNRYQINLIINKCLAISYYKKIEKRGFRIVDIVNKKELSQEMYVFENINS